MSQLKRNKNHISIKLPISKMLEDQWSNAFNGLRKNNFHSKILNSTNV